MPAEKAIIFWLIFLTSIGYISVLLTFIGTTNKNKEAEYNKWKDMVFLDRLFYAFIMGAISYVIVIGIRLVYYQVKNMFYTIQQPGNMPISASFIIATILSLLILSIETKKKDFFDRLGAVIGSGVIIAFAIFLASGFLNSLSNVLNITVAWIDTKPSWEDGLNVIVLPTFIIIAIVEWKTRWFSKLIKTLKKKFSKLLKNPKRKDKV